MVSQSFAFIVALLLCLGYASAVEDAFKPVAFPAVQTSVTSTQFNPAIQNPGGTTNSAGTFNVVSLSQSTSVPYNSVLPQTTSFVITSPNIAQSADVVTPAYLTQVGNPTSEPQAASTTPGVSISSGGKPIIALSTVAGNSDAAMVQVPVVLTWTLLLSGAAAVVGAVFVL